MANQFTNRFNLGVFALVFAVVAIAALSGVMATQALEDDGRINLVHHLGGDAVFCTGANNIASDSYVNGGIQLLSASGQQLFFVPAATINAVPEMPLVNTRIAQGWGTFGPVELWRLTNGDFTLVGQDEHGKPYNFQWTGCEQIGTDAERSSNEANEPECDEPQGGNGNDWVNLAPDDCPVVTEEPNW
jgi:hypothetical protein